MDYMVETFFDDFWWIEGLPSIIKVSFLSYIAGPRNVNK